MRLDPRLRDWLLRPDMTDDRERRALEGFVEKLEALSEDEVEALFRAAGGPGSGNFGHAGRPGKVGGSASSSGGGGLDTSHSLVSEDLLLQHIAPWKDPGGYRHTGIKWQQKTDQQTGRPIPIKVTSVEEGAELILQGKVVEFDSPEQAYTVIDELGKRALAAGEHGKDFDLCGVTVKGTSLFCAESIRTEGFPDGIPRIEMPQLGGKTVPGSAASKLPEVPWKPGSGEVDGGPSFRTFLGGLGLTTTEEAVPASSLRASQREMKGVTVGGMIRDYDRPVDDPKKFDPAANPIFISQDGYVIDGHHRWAAVVGIDARDGRLGDLNMNVIRVNAPISEVLHIGSVWASAFGIKQSAGVVKQTAATGLVKGGS